MSKQPIYGFPCVTDPRDFLPDVECCSPTEIETHQTACKTFGKPEHQPNKGSFTEFNDKGEMVLHVCRTSWGIGTNLIDSCDECREPADNLMTCHECHGMEFCAVCWPQHEKRHEDGEL